MRTLIVVCDRCKKEINDLKQCWEVSAGLTKYERKLKAEWCRSCCIEMGILDSKEPTANPIVEPKPTIEDFIREMIREEIG